MCRQTLCFLHSVSEKRLTTLKNHLTVEGVTEQLYGNTKRVPVNATTYEQTEKSKLFIKNYVNAVNIPGRILGYDSGKLMLLPISHNKLFVYEKYQTACEDANYQTVSLWVFRKLWNSFFPYVFATKPRTDLCMTCQQNISLVMRMQNCEDNDKKKQYFATQGTFRFGGETTYGLSAEVHIIKKSF